MFKIIVNDWDERERFQFIEGNSIQNLKKPHFSFQEFSNNCNLFPSGQYHLGCGRLLHIPATCVLPISSNKWQQKSGNDIKINIEWMMSNEIWSLVSDMNTFFCLILVLYDAICKIFSFDILSGNVLISSDIIVFSSLPHVQMSNANVNACCSNMWPPCNITPTILV